MAARQVLSSVMATISLNDAGRDLEGPVRFSLGAEHFELSDNDTYETDSAEVIANAQANPNLNVDIQVDEQADPHIQEQIEASKTSSDPHVNPRADHLRAEADPAVVEAAQREADRLRAFVSGVTPEAFQEAENAPESPPTPQAQRAASTSTSPAPLFDSEGDS